MIDFQFESFLDNDSSHLRGEDYYTIVVLNNEQFEFGARGKVQTVAN